MTCLPSSPSSGGGLLGPLHALANIKACSGSKANHSMPCTNSSLGDPWYNCVPAGTVAMKRDIPLWLSEEPHCRMDECMALNIWFALCGLVDLMVEVSADGTIGEEYTKETDERTARDDRKCIANVYTTETLISTRDGQNDAAAF
jgi:hypothetical protein